MGRRLVRLHTGPFYFIPVDPPHCSRAIKGAPLTLISHPASGANSSAALFLSSLRKGLRTKQQCNTLFWCSICRVHWRVAIGRGTCEEGDADVLEEEGLIAIPIETGSVGYVYSVTLSMISSTPSRVSFSKQRHIVACRLFFNSARIILYTEHRFLEAVHEE